ncbi:hypothetical protein NIES22_17320 [Calothrix brevissima NIES-22]|nr:hypothetical protein NIES22_17320 [Calothrix brevissima NIES-22]
MKIVEETRTRLQIKHRPIANWFSGGIILIASFSFLIYCIFFESASASLTCKRPQANQINCDLKRFNLLGFTDKRKIFDPQEAYIQQHRGSKGGTTYKVIIVTPLDEYPFLSNLSYEKNQELAEKINNFIHSQETYLSVQANQRSYVFLFIIFVLTTTGIGAFLVTTPVSNFTFYKSLNKVLIERKGLRAQESIEYPLASISRFDIQDKQFKNSKLYRAVMIVNLIQEIPINPQYTDEKSVRYVISRINYFLNVDN